MVRLTGSLTFFLAWLSGSGAYSVGEEARIKLGPNVQVSKADVAAHECSLAAISHYRTGAMVPQLA